MHSYSVLAVQQRLGFASSLSPSTVPISLTCRHVPARACCAAAVNLVYTDVHWPVDISNARRLLGWQPTPWRRVAAQLAAQWARQRGVQA